MKTAKKKYPHLKFKINKKLDKEMGVAFLEHKKAGLNFGKAILLFHPKLQKVVSLPKDQKGEVIGKYVDDFYAKNKKELIKAAEKFQKTWSQKAQRFFLLTDKVFKNHPWPKGKYLAFLSIFPSGPRFLDTKTFQVFWRDKRGPLILSAHEMLHFLFYDYLEKRFPEVKNISTEKIWSLSEIVNFFILNSSSFRQITGQEESLYPNLQKLANRFLPIWKKSTSINDFLIPGLKLLKGA